MNSKQVTDIISDFNKHWPPQTLSVAENICSRFMAGECLIDVADDYDLISHYRVDSALRFFILFRAGSKRVVNAYNEIQAQRFEAKEDGK